MLGSAGFVGLILVVVFVVAVAFLADWWASREMDRFELMEHRDSGQDWLDDYERTVRRAERAEHGDSRGPE